MLTQSSVIQKKICFAVSEASGSSKLTSHFNRKKNTQKIHEDTNFFTGQKKEDGNLVAYHSSY